MDRSGLTSPEIAALPKKDRRFWVKLSLEGGDNRAHLYDAYTGDFAPATMDVSVTVDPSDFLDYVTPAEIIKAGKLDGLWQDFKENERQAVLGQLDAVCSYEVDELLATLRDAIKSQRLDDALLALDRFENPKFKTPAAFEAAFKLAQTEVHS
jgi:hypothetical protein